MAVLAYVLITVRHGTNQEVAEKLMKFKEVEEVHILYGQYDIIIKVKEDDMKELEEFLFTQVKTVPGIESTETLISSDVV